MIVGPFEKAVGAVDNGEHGPGQHEADNTFLLLDAWGTYHEVSIS